MKGNMGVFDRILRIIIAVLLAILYFARIVSGTLGVIFLIIAIIFLITSITNFCLLYKILGISTKKVKE
ncbi:MAG: YgaP family membrane protein [Candidatus Aminicenantia bacterium]